ncbi:MAG: hypothetical protein ABIH46_01385 [Chloroflexota bacterium]
MALKIHRPDEFDVVVVGTKDTAWLKEDLKEEIEAGLVRYVDAEEEPELVKEIFGKDPGEVTQPLAVVAAKGEQDGLTCALSAVGRSIIIHCENQIIDIRRRKDDENLPREAETESP